MSCKGNLSTEAFSYGELECPHHTAAMYVGLTCTTTDTNTPQPCTVRDFKISVSLFTVGQLRMTKDPSVKGIQDQAYFNGGRQLDLFHCCRIY